MKLFIAIAIAVSLSGCSMLSSSVREHTPEPIEQEVDVVSHWSSKVGGGAKGSGHEADGMPLLLCMCMCMCINWAFILVE